MGSQSVWNLSKQHAGVACMHEASNHVASVDCLSAAARRQALGKDAGQPARRSSGQVRTLAAVAERMAPPALQKPTFVEVLRGAAPYVQSHRNSTCVVCLPSEVMMNKQLLTSVLSDLVLLHNMNVRLVLVLGVRHQMDKLLAARGLEPHYVDGYRVTDMDVMTAAAEATGAARVEVEAALSKALSTQVLRRHNRSSDGIRHGPPVEVVYGNWVNGKRRGVVEGVDYGYTGKVRSLNTASISSQLQAGHIVLLTSLAYSLAGEVLNCNVFDIATHAAVELAADKLIVMSAEDLQATSGVPPWLPLNDAIQLLQEDPTSDSLSTYPDQLEEGAYPNSLTAAVRACKHGVKRTHVINARTPGALLVELYSRDGLGVMVSGDFFEGIRAAGPQDISAIRRLYKSLALDMGLQTDLGVLSSLSDNDLSSPFLRVFVIEREGQVLGCAVLAFVGEAEEDGLPCAELTAFCVHPAYRGAGRTDSLLDYVEQSAREECIRRLFFLSGPAILSSPDWFLERSFEDAGPAEANAGLIPSCRAERIDREQSSRLFCKGIQPPDDVSCSVPVGKRIGF